MSKMMTSQETFIVSCPFGVNFGAMPHLCRQFTRTAPRNLNGCAKTNCGSPHKVCRACVTQGGEPSLVTEDGLCAFHAEHGVGARPEAKRLDRPLQRRDASTVVDLDDKPRVRVFRAEVIEGERLVVGESHFETICTISEPTRKPRSAEATPSPVLPEAILPRVRWSNKPTMACVKVFDPEKGDLVFKNVLVVLEALEQMKASKMTWTEIAKKLRMCANSACVIYSLRNLVPAVRDMLSPERKASERIGQVYASWVAQLRPELQERALNAYLGGAWSQNQLRAFTRDKANHRPNVP